MMNFRRTFRLALLLASGLVLASCGSDGNNNTSFRMIQASPDLALVNLVVDGTILRGAIDYNGGPGFLTVTPQTYEFGIEAIEVGADGLVVNRPITPPVQKVLVAGSEYTLIAIGKDATDTLQSLVVENLTEDVPQGDARFQFVHAAPDMPAVVDIYVTAVPALPEVLPDLSTQTPLAEVTYGEQPAPRQLLPAGKYVIRVTLAGSTEAVFDSGELTFSNGNDFMMVVVDNTAAGSSPISLAVNSGFRAYYNPAGTFSLLDKNSPSELRVVQVSPDAPVMDVVGDPATADLPDKTFATALTYRQYTGYVPTLPDSYIVKGVPTSDPNTTTPLFTVTGNLLSGQRTNLFTTGPAASMVPLVLVGDTRPIYRQGKLRIVDASPSAGTVDVYIVAPGTDIATVDPTLVNLVLRSATSYLPFFPGNYTVTFTVAGTKTVMATAEVPATGGTAQTAVLVDAVSSDGTPREILLIDDQAP